jgi:hypothetical protein
MLDPTARGAGVPLSRGSVCCALQLGHPLHLPPTEDEGKPEAVGRIATARKPLLVVVERGVAEQLPNCSRSSSHLLEAANASAPPAEDVT